MSENLAKETATFDTAWAAAQKVVEGITSDPMAPADSLDSWIPSLFEDSNWQPELIVLSTMIASGDLTLVRDPSLQSALIRFQERSRAMVDRRILGDEMTMQGFRSMIAKGDFLVWAPQILGTSPTGDRWSWSELAGDVAFRNGIYSMVIAIRSHRLALDTLAVELERLRTAVVTARS